MWTDYQKKGIKCDLTDFEKDPIGDALKIGLNAAFLNGAQSWTLVKTKHLTSIFMVNNCQWLEKIAWSDESRSQLYHYYSTLSMWPKQDTQGPSFSVTTVQSGGGI